MLRPASHGIACAQRWNGFEGGLSYFSTEPACLTFWGSGCQKTAHSTASRAQPVLGWRREINRADRALWPKTYWLRRPVGRERAANDLRHGAPEIVHWAMEVTISIRSKYDAELGLLFTTATGLVSYEEVQKHLDEEARSGMLVYPEIFDATNAWTNLTDEEVRQIVRRLVELNRTNSLGPTAVVTNNDVLYGMASMLGILSELQGGPRFGVFRDFDAGLKWLIRCKAG